MQPKTLFKKKELWKKCAPEHGHAVCSKFDKWREKHPQDYNELNYESKQSYRSVFVPGKSVIILNGKTLEIDGGIKSLDPPCLGTAFNVGPHPFTCINCYAQRVSFKDLISKRQNASLPTRESRIGQRGFRTSYATKEEMDEYNISIEKENKELKLQNKRLSRTLYSKKAWQKILTQSYLDDDIKKMTIDLISLFEQRDKRESIQFALLKNLLLKMKSGVNHKFTLLIKNVACLYKNHLGTTNYSLLQSLFGLPGKTCASDHAKPAEINLGFNNNAIETATERYANRPVVECSDEARTLRYISPLMDQNGKIELIGQCWDADLNRWNDERKYLDDILSKNSIDQYSALKDYVDGIIKTNQLAKDTAIHNFTSGSGIASEPIVFLVWPTPNSGYCGPHLLKIWDVIRTKSFLNEDNSLKINPLNLIGHSTDSAGFQLAAALSLMSPNKEAMKEGVKYLTLGIGESCYASPYFGPLPSIAFLDYDHGLRLFLRCLKYNTLEMNFFPNPKVTYSAAITHLKELKLKCDETESSLECPFSNNDLLFARYLDQNCDAAIKVFQPSVADMLEKNVNGAEGTVLYLRAVIYLFEPFLNPSSDPIYMQTSISTGITVLRIWRKILQLKKKRLTAAPKAAKEPAKRSFFLTYGCYKTAEILFASATSYMLTIFLHFKHLGPTALSPFKCGTKATERIISEVQGKTNQFQSLDAQPTLLDIIHRVSKVQMNHLVEEELIAAGAKKLNSTNRRRLSHKLQSAKVTEYKYPDTFLEFLNHQRQAYKDGVKMGVELYREYCEDGIQWLENQCGLDFLHQNGTDSIPKENCFDGSIDNVYALRMLTEISPSILLTQSVMDKEKKINEYFKAERESEEFESCGEENIETNPESPKPSTTANTEDTVESEEPQNNKWLI
uniref:Uncharacterized protein n=1 Tax=Clytia hemisphaerica TaxID=252671 RepID=A0A7M5TTT6_9CNID